MICQYKIRFKENNLWQEKSCKHEAVEAVTISNYSLYNKKNNYNTIAVCQYHLSKLEEKNFNIIQSKKL